MEKHSLNGNDNQYAPVGSASTWKEGIFWEGVSPNMRAVEIVTRELAQSEVPVLLLAERGAGKLATAHRIHALSTRSEQDFRVLPCKQDGVDFAGKLGPELHGGTIFLQEVTALSAAGQASLLDVLSAIEVKGRGLSCLRLICGSSRDMDAEVRAKRFREDLYYRISGVCLRLPPLRQRKEDIPHLMAFFLAKYAQEFCRPIPVLSGETQQLFQDYAWPGNIRELEDAAKAIVVLGNETVAMGGLRAVLMKADSPGNGKQISLKQAARAASREAEKELILQVLNRTRWNRRRAAQELQISYKALLYKLKQIGYGESEYQAS